MTLTKSNMLELGNKAPDFKLPEVETGEMIGLEDFAGNDALLVMFICHHCPYVKHVQEELAKIANDYKDSSLGIVAISANDANTHPDDRPESLREMKVELGFSFPFCHDETQEVAKSYTAACTPDFFLFDQDRKLTYRGRLDSSRPGNDEPVTGKDMRAAIDAVLQGEPADQDQQPSMGCNIKWKPGNEPDYFSS